MKLNNKGFSLIELLIAFTAVTLLSFAIFRTVISIQRRQQINIIYNDYVVFQSQLNSQLQKDFTNKIIEAIEYCGNNCYDIKFVGEPVKKLSINRNDNTLSYGVIKQKLPKVYLKMLKKQIIIMYFNLLIQSILMFQKVLAHMLIQILFMIQTSLPKNWKPFLVFLFFPMAKRFYLLKNLY